jgi:putative membrane protein
MNARMILAGLCCGAMCSLSAVAQTGASNGADQKFVDMAAQTDMMEAHLGQLAADQAGKQGVKDYGQMLVTDHTNDYQQLSAAATKGGATIPKGLNASSDKMIAPFEKLKGPAFDHRFIREMIVGHTKAIAEYKHEAADGKSDSVKAYASQALPTLEKHLHDAEALEKAKK